jgi:aldehyde dehydrogenase (NAD+)
MSQFSPQEILNALSLKDKNAGTSTGSTTMTSTQWITSYSPIDGAKLGEVSTTSEADYQKVVAQSQNAFKALRSIPGPKRGELIRQFGNALREEKAHLGGLVSL